MDMVERERNQNEMAENLDCNPNDENRSKKHKVSASKKIVKFKKAPQAPRRFKSAYMFFSTAKHPEIRAKITQDGKTTTKTTDVAKLVSKAWKNLSNEEREKWDDMARKDKERFELEKSMYTGPWKVPKRKGSDRDPNEPKRPMSSFLSYSNSIRSVTKKEHPDKSNAEISRILAQKWKEAPEEERNVHIEKEKKLREEYKKAMAQYKKDIEEELEAQRTERETAAKQYQDGGRRPYADSQYDEQQRQHQQQTGAPYNSTDGSTSGYPGHPHHEYTGTAPSAASSYHHYYGHGGAHDMSSYYQSGGDSTNGGASSSGGPPPPPPPSYHSMYGQQGGIPPPPYYHPSYGGYQGSYGHDHAADGGGYQQPYNNEYNNSSGAGVHSSSDGYSGYYAPPSQPHYTTSTGYGGSNEYHHDERYGVGGSHYPGLGAPPVPTEGGD
mmetsp:Transcript_15656/g.22077  ORF Transcript_15656/g.22077 Transcript_15656/m.22077 type:complete len:439 (+) Transcript_15656:198-1514(+)